MKKINCAVIGCGRIGCGFDDGQKQNIMTHAGSYFKNNKTNLMALSDIDKTKLKKYGKKYSISNLYTDSSELFTSHKIDCVSICTLADSHLELVRQAVSTNVKAIFLEKPISNSLKNAKTIIDLCKKNNTILGIDFQRRYDPFYHKIKKILSQNKLGKIQMVNALYGGGIFNTGTHLFDILRYFFGEIQTINSNFSKNKSQNKNDPNCDVIVHFKNNIVSNIHSLNYNNYVIFTLDIFGTNGRLQINLVDNNYIFESTKNSGTVSGYKKLKQQQITYKKPKNSAIYLAIENIINCLKNQKQPSATGIDGYRSLESTIACKLSAEKNQIISLPIHNMNYNISSK